MEKLKIFYLKYKHAVPLIIYAIIYMTWFAWLEKNITGHYRIIHMAADDYIPFCEVFVIPYFLWFAYVSAVVIYFFFKNKEDYYRTCIFLFTGMTIFLIICTVWHNGLNLRQDISYNNNLCARLVKMLYKTDTSTNVFPSLHVFNTLGCLVALYKSKGMKDKAWIKVIATIIGILIILSTIFLKQHSVWDVIGAFALAAILYPIVYVIPWGRKKQ